MRRERSSYQHDVRFELRIEYFTQICSAVTKKKFILANIKRYHNLGSKSWSIKRKKKWWHSKSICISFSFDKFERLVVYFKLAELVTRFFSVEINLLKKRGENWALSQRGNWVYANDKTRSIWRLVVPMNYVIVAAGLQPECNQQEKRILDNPPLIRFFFISFSPPTSSSSPPSHPTPFVFKKTLFVNDERQIDDAPSRTVNARLAT